MAQGSSRRPRGSSRPTCSLSAKLSSSLGVGLGDEDAVHRDASPASRSTWSSGTCRPARRRTAPRGRPAAARWRRSCRPGSSHATSLEPSNPTTMTSLRPAASRAAWAPMAMVSLPEMIALDVRVGLEDRLGLGEGLGLAPVGALAGDRLQLRVLVDDVVVALGADAGVGVRLLADQLGVVALLLHPLDELLGPQGGALVVVGDDLGHGDAGGVDLAGRYVRSSSAARAMLPGSSPKWSSRKPVSPVGAKPVTPRMRMGTGQRWASKAATAEPIPPST